MSILDSARKILKGKEKSANLILLGILLILSGATFESLVILGNTGQLFTLLGVLSFMCGFSLYGMEAIDEQREKKSKM